MNVWFGTSWGAPINDLLTHVETPVGVRCLWCNEPIAADDSGWGQGSEDHWMHKECFIRQMLGSIGHQLKLCSCFGGDYEDPPNMSIRDQARVAFEQAQALKKRDLDEA